MNDVNYIVAGDNTQHQLQFLYNGDDIMDLDAGALTVYTNVIAKNVAQYYTINSGGIGQWFNLGTLHTTQEGRHFLIRITYSSDTITQIRRKAILQQSISKHRIMVQLI
jgi:ribosomal protein S6